MEVDHQDGVMGSKEQALIAKGKRTKRQRLHSPTPFAVPANSSSGEGGFGVGDSNFVAENNDYEVVVQNQNNFSASSSAVELQQYNTVTEEEEDMANCLILLAQGRPHCSPPKHVETRPIHHLNNVRRFPVENVAVGTEKGGSGCINAYECKTCYRTFPSFQALGGHRASHKKPKAMEAEKKLLLSYDDEEIQFKNNVTHTLSLQLNQRGSLYSSGKAKVHECAVCGAEFTSGQALGGHMRRHRAMPVGTTTNTALSLTPMATAAEDQRQPKRQRSVLSLDLDLNLPAPQEHDHRESKFLMKSNHHQQQQLQQQPQQQQHNKQQQQPQQQQHNKQQQQPQQQQHNKQQQQPLVFPARTLVDCHY